MTKFTKYKDGCSIYLDDDYGPCFGNGNDLFGSGCDLFISPDMNEGWIDNSNYLRNYELTDGNSEFVVNEIEVFQVEFN